MGEFEELMRIAQRNTEKIEQDLERKRKRKEQEVERQKKEELQRRERQKTYQGAALVARKERELQAQKRATAETIERRKKYEDARSQLIPSSSKTKSTSNINVRNLGPREPPSTNSRNPVGGSSFPSTHKPSANLSFEELMAIAAENDKAKHVKKSESFLPSRTPPPQPKPLNPLRKPNAFSLRAGGKDARSRNGTLSVSKTQSISRNHPLNPVNRPVDRKAIANPQRFKSEIVEAPTTLRKTQPSLPASQRQIIVPNRVPPKSPIRSKAAPPPGRKQLPKTTREIDHIDEDYARTNYSDIIRGMFGYDRRKYNDDFSDDDMEVSISRIRAEEVRSSRIGRMEDEEEEERERLQQEHLHQKRFAKSKPKY